MKKIKKNRTTTIENVTVGKPDVKPEMPSHVAGVKRGNAKGKMQREAGIHREGEGARGTAERSTGINPKERNAILPGMPNISPP